MITRAILIVCLLFPMTSSHSTKFHDNINFAEEKFILALYENNKTVEEFVNITSLLTKNLETPPKTLLDDHLGKSNVSETFIQSYCGPNINFMTGEQINRFTIMLMYNTDEYAIGDPLVDTESLFIKQKLYYVEKCPDTEVPSINLPDNTRNRKRNVRTLQQQNTIDGFIYELRVKFAVIWSSEYLRLNATRYVENFMFYSNLGATKNATVHKLNYIGVEAEEASNIRVSKNQPVSTNTPSYAPTAVPFALKESSEGQLQQQQQQQPTIPTASDADKKNKGESQPSPPKEEDESNNIILSTKELLYLVVVIVCSTIIGISILYLLLCKRREFINFCKKDNAAFLFHKATISRMSSSNDNRSNSNHSKEENITDDDMISTKKIVAIAYANSKVIVNKKQQTQPQDIQKQHTRSADNKQSFLSSTEDELEKYYDQRLTKLTNLVISSIYNLEELMSRSKTNALLLSESQCKHELNKTRDMALHEIEANMLYSTVTWCKVTLFFLDDDEDYDEQKATIFDYLQHKLLQPIILYVMHNLISVQDAARMIHECCALLKLPLKKSLSNNTLLITGLRKNVVLDDIQSLFSQFGPIQDVGLAPISQETGIYSGFVRFVNDDSCDFVMKTYRTGEIVVRDVAVVVRAISTYAVIPDKEKDTVIDSNAKQEEKQLQLSFLLTNDEQFNQSFHQLSMMQKRQHEREHAIKEDDNKNNNESKSQTKTQNQSIDPLEQEYERSSSWPLLIAESDQNNFESTSVTSQVHLMEFSTYS